MIVRREEINGVEYLFQPGAVVAPLMGVTFDFDNDLDPALDVQVVPIAPWSSGATLLDRRPQDRL